MKQKKHIATYAQAMQTSPDDYRTIRTSMVITTETKVIDILNWLYSLGVVSPDLTMVDISFLDEDKEGFL